MGLDLEVNVNFVSEQSVIDTPDKLETSKLIPNHELLSYFKVFNSFSHYSKNN